MGNKRLSGAEALVLFLAAIGAVFVFLGIIGFDAGNRAGNSQDVMRSTWYLGMGVFLWILCVPYFVWRLRRKSNKS